MPQNGKQFVKFMSCVTCHVSHATCHMSHAFFYHVIKIELIEGLLSTEPTPSSSANCSDPESSIGRYWKSPDFPRVVNTSPLGRLAGKEGHQDGLAGRPAGQEGQPVWQEGLTGRPAWQEGLQPQSPGGKQLEQSQAEIPGRTFSGIKIWK